MKVAIIGASGKSGRHLVRESLERGHEVVAVCRDKSVEKLTELEERKGVTVVSAPVVSDEAMLTKALAGCDAVVAILVSIMKLRATRLVRALAGAAGANGVTRLVFTAGEVTAVRTEGERLTLRQRVLLAVASALLAPTPISIGDMRRASELIAAQPGWDWTIFRAPTLRDKPAEGYRLCDISDVTGKHALSRADYAACMLDSLTNPEHHGRTLTVVPSVGRAGATSVP